MSRIPASAKTSPSPRFPTVSPDAPASSCIRAIRTLLWVFAWGRRAMPRRPRAAWRRSMFALAASTQTTTAGVSRPVGSGGIASAARAGSVAVIASVLRTGTGDDGSREAAETLDREDDLVAGLEVPAERGFADLEETTCPDGAAPDQVSRAQTDVRGRALKHVSEREVRVRPATARGLDAVDARRHDEVRCLGVRFPRVRQLVRRHDPRSDRAREVLALGRPEPHGRLLALEVTGRPVVEDRVATDRLLGAVCGQIAGRCVDDGAHLELVVELDGVARRPHRVARAADLGHVREVEDGQPVPRLGHVLATSLPHRPDVALERVEVAEGGWPKDGGPEDEIDGVEDGAVVLAVRAAAAEALDDLAERLDTKAA